MMKNALIKDTYREIKGSLSRFMSILLIVMLGSGFFAGIKATMPDMVDMASAYFDDNRLMDLKLVSTIGVRSQDVEAVKACEGVSGAMAAYSKDVFYLYQNRNVVLKFMSYNRTLDPDSENLMNTLSLSKGRMPENAGECLVEKCLGAPDTFEIGNKITVTEPDREKPLSDSLRTDTYKIVGIVDSPLYIGFERDYTTVGTGSVLCNVYLPEEEFTGAYYSEMFVRFSPCRGLDPFSDKYKDTVAKYSKAVTKAFTDSVTGRYDKLISQAQATIDSSQTAADMLSEVLEYDDKTLAAAREQTAAAIKTGEKELSQAEEDGRLSRYLIKAEIAKGEKLVGIIDELLADTDGSARAGYVSQLEDAQAQLADARKQLADTDEPIIYSLDRFEASVDYSGFEGDAMKIDSISKVFPVFFIIVAALVCLTTMTRMVEEQRITLGTYKALGYGGFRIASKYLCYCTAAAVIGSEIGVAIGLQVFPRIIYSCYKIMYNIPKITTPFRPLYLAGCMAVSVVCVCAAAGFTCYKELRSQPASLMRPKPPKDGRRVLLERVPAVWNRLGFLGKVTLRNLLRYKKRFFMTLAGIAGCTALIITGFGLKHSIKSIAQRQFKDVFVYDGIISLNNNNYTREQLHSALSDIDQIDKFLMIMSQNADTDKSQSVTLMVPGEPDRLDDYVILRDCESGEVLELQDDEAIVTEKLAILCDYKIGDTVTLKRKGYPDVSVKIGAIAKNYALHYVCVTPNTYEKLYGEEPVFNAAFTNLKDDADKENFKKALNEDEHFYGLTYKSDSSKGFLKSVDSLDAVVILLIVCAGGLAFIVLYNLANINITERRRELATVKVLGFFDKETSAYIYRENIISAVLGVLLGFGVGAILHRFVVLTSEVDVVMFNRQLVWWAYLLGALLTAVFTLLVNILLHFKLKRIDMVESLKSVE